MTKTQHTLGTALGIGAIALAQVALKGKDLAVIDMLSSLGLKVAPGPAEKRFAAAELDCDQSVYSTEALLSVRFEVTT